MLKVVLGKQLFKKIFDEDAKTHLKVCKMCTKILSMHILLENT